MNCTNCGSDDTVIYPSEGPGDPEVLHCWECDNEEDVSS